MPVQDRRMPTNLPKTAQFICCVCPVEKMVELTITANALWEILYFYSREQVQCLQLNLSRYVDRIHGIPIVLL